MHELLISSDRGANATMVQLIFRKLHFVASAFEHNPPNDMSTGMSY
jgi:hypothetical protein